jgi:hypothetical protein
MISAANTHCKYPQYVESWNIKSTEWYTNSENKFSATTAEIIYQKQDKNLSISLKNMLEAMFNLNHEHCYDSL